jgi:hypothetical protein
MALLVIIKRLIPTFIFYACAVVNLFFLQKLSPGGPCTPGLSIVGFFLLIPLIIGLLIYNIYLAINKDQSHGIAAFIHAAVLVVIFVALNA